MILKLIASEDIDTQEELARLLSAQGFTVTQATVSRDIKEGGIRSAGALYSSVRQLRRFDHLIR